MKEFNCDGVEVGKVKPDIKSGDRVMYTDTVRVGNKQTKRTLVGVWDGEKVCFADKDRTVVRNVWWVEKIK